jgi:ParB family chromosome partitioning protein
MSEIKKIAISRIIMTGDNPRQEFDEDSLIDLGKSIRTHGLLQPIIVRPKGDYFELVIGERRVRASELVGLTEIEARIEELDDVAVMELRLIENTHREDLTNAEKGDAVYTLWERFPQKYPTIKSVADAISVPYGTVQKWCAKSRKLSEHIKELVARSLLTERAAHYLLKYDHDTQDKLAEAIVKFDIRGGRKGAERDFIKLYDGNPEADLKELAEKAKGFKIVSIPLKKLSEEAREEVEEVLKEKEKEIEETRKKAIERARKAPRRKRPDIVVTKADLGRQIVSNLPFEFLSKNHGRFVAVTFTRKILAVCDTLEALNRKIAEKDMKENYYIARIGYATIAQI